MICPHGIHMDNACGACEPPRGTTVRPTDDYETRMRAYLASRGVPPQIIEQNIAIHRDSTDGVGGRDAS